MDIDRVCSVCDAKLSSETQRSIAMFAEVVWHVLVNLGRTEGWCHLSLLQAHCLYAMNLLTACACVWARAGHKSPNPYEMYSRSRRIIGCEPAHQLMPRQFACLFLIPQSDYIVISLYRLLLNSRRPFMRFTYHVQYSGTRLIRTPSGHAEMSVLSGCPH